MSELHISVLIVAPPGRWRDSLAVLLRAGGLKLEIELVDDGPGLPRLAGGPPAVVLVDAGLPNDGAWQLLGSARRDWPPARCVVLAHTLAQEQRARSVGADAVLQVGFSGEALYTTMRALLEGSYP